MASRRCQTCLQKGLPPTFLLPQLSPQWIPRRTIKSISTPKKSSRFTKGLGLPRLTSSVEDALIRKTPTIPERCGALGIKQGMSAYYDTETGKRHPCTVVQMDRVQVVSHKFLPTHTYWAVQLGAGSKMAKNVTRAMLGHFASNAISPKRYLAEFRVKDRTGLLPIGQTITPSWFQEGQYVDARADCKGKGFAGVMKKHGFKGQDRSHGVSKTHRSMGSAGGSQGSGSRVIPGKKMAGRMGGQRVTVQNVKVYKVNDESGLVVLHGCIPGPNGSLVKLSDAIKKPWPTVPETAAAAESGAATATA